MRFQKLFVLLIGIYKCRFEEIIKFCLNRQATHLPPNVPSLKACHSTWISILILIIQHLDLL
jgi:hypothetical protein